MRLRRETVSQGKSASQIADAAYQVMHAHDHQLHILYHNIHHANISCKFYYFFLFVFIDSVYYVTYVYYAHFNSSFVTPLSLFFLSFLYIFFYKRSLFRLNSTYRPGAHRFISLVYFWLCEFTVSYFQFCYYRTFIVFYNQPMFKLWISWA